MTFRPIVSAAEYVAIARAITAGEPHPFYVGDVAEVLADIALAVMNEASDARRRIEYLESTGASAVAANGRVWRLVYAAHKRLTMRTADVRAALVGDPVNIDEFVARRETT